MANLRNDREESVGFQRDDHFVNLERKRDRDHNPTSSVRVETQHPERIKRSHLRTGSHVSHNQEKWNLNWRLTICVKSCCRVNETRRV